MKTTRTRIDSGWTVRPLPLPDMNPALELPPLPAQVPGQVHLDLHRAGVIPDPFYRLQERDVAWVDDTDWVYETVFHVDEVPDADVLLSFLGLDTIAAIHVNGEQVGAADNMFVPHEFSIHPLLRPGENTLQVTFRSARRVGRERHAAWSREHDSMPAHYFLWDARSFVRKAQYMFGWDWGPILISCGIWRPVELVTVPAARLLDWSYRPSLSEKGASIDVEVAVERASARPGPLSVTVEVGGRSATAALPAEEGRVCVSLTLAIDDPQLWSPENPVLYDLRLTVESGETLIDERQVRIGLRTVQLIRERDADGSGEGFLFRLNGENLFCRGANWIPADSFPARSYDNRDRLHALLFAAKEAGFNMLRVWGGGMYESDTFYDLCDELGILVWQDFPYACAYYPDDPGSLSVAAAEATAAVRRLRVHPSLALWCGNNENQEMFHDNWRGLNPPHFLGQAIYDTVLPRVVEEEDGSTPYWPGSSFGGENPSSQDIGDRHNWDVWHAKGESDGDWPNYARDRARFCSEFGFASSCSTAAWDTCLAPSDRSPTSPAVRWHDKTAKPYDIYLGYIERHFPSVRTLDDLVYYSQLNQAEAMKFGVEHYRRLKGRCWGTLIWQINDCWPVQSWSMIDSVGERKAVYYAAKHFYAPVLLSLVRDGEGFDVHLVNDRLEPVSGQVTLRLARFDGTILDEGTESVSVARNGAAKVARISLHGTPADSPDVYAHASLVTDDPRSCVENLAFLVEPRELRLPTPEVRTTVRETDRGPAVTLQAENFAAYVRLMAAGLEPLEWSDNFLHLLPGRSYTVTLGQGDTLDADTLRDHLQVRSFSP